MAATPPAQRNSLQHCAAATEQWTGDAYDDQLAILGTRVPIDTDEPVPLHDEDHTRPT